MTKEDFFELAKNRPVMKEPSIYRLTVLAYDSHVKGYHKNEDDEWVLDLEMPAPMYFSSREEAEKVLATANEELTFFRKMHSAVIDRLPLDTGFRQMPIAWWKYDGEGKMTDQSVCSDFHTFDKRTSAGKFFGRRKDEIRFKAGDFIEVYDEDQNTGGMYVKIVKVLKTPNTIEQEWEEFDKCQQSAGNYPFNGFYVSAYFNDAIADNYLCFSSDFHDEQPVKKVFAPTFPIPEEVMESLSKKEKNFLHARHCMQQYADISLEDQTKLINGELTEEDIKKRYKRKE